MNKNYGERWRKLLAEIDIYKSGATASLTLFHGGRVRVSVGVSDGTVGSPYENRDFRTSPKGLVDARQWAVETKRKMAEHLINPAHQRAETVQKQVGVANG